MHKKKIFYHKNGNLTVKEKTCHPKGLPSKIRYIAPYWHLAFESVLHYQKERGLQEIHKIVDTSRIEKGLELYRKGKIKEITVTTAFQGDVNALVESEDGKKQYRIVMKNFLPEKGKLPQYNFERERFISEFLVTCSCDDHILGRYSSNVSILCKHCMAIIWFLIDNYDMPKIFIRPVEMICGYKKSDIEEIEVEIATLPLVKFRRFINVLLMKNFRGMKAALGISIHTVNNETDREDNKPMWITFCNKKDVVRLVQGLTSVLNKMSDKGERYVFEKASESGVEIKFVAVDVEDIREKPVDHLPVKDGKMKKSCDNCRYCRMQDFTPDPLCWYYESKEISRFACTLPASNICEHWEKKQIKIV